ncbi:amidase family protein [Nocardia sp. CA-084685]|uniref:amidase family protein n=1 Tax=Nocardia sp. CA-084685 TaxID=3239970 RepID=UPI003D99EAAA
MNTGQDSALWTRDAVSLATLIAEGAVTAAQVVEAHLERIEQVDSEIAALTTVFAETARAEAAAADRRVPIGPLHGVPVTIKNNLDVAGSPTTWGVAAFGQAVAGSGCTRGVRTAASRGDRHRANEHAGLRHSLAHRQRRGGPDGESVEPDSQPGRFQRR